MRSGSPILHSGRNCTPRADVAELAGELSFCLFLSSFLDFLFFGGRIFLRSLVGSWRSVVVVVGWKSGSWKGKMKRSCRGESIWVFFMQRTLNYLPGVFDLSCDLPRWAPSSLFMNSVANEHYSLSSPLLSSPLASHPLLSPLPPIPTPQTHSHSHPIPFPFPFHQLLSHLHSPAIAITSIPKSLIPNPPPYPQIITIHLHL